MTRILRRQPLQRPHERVVHVLLVNGHVPLARQLQRALKIGARDRVQPLVRRCPNSPSGAHLEKHSHTRRVVVAERPGSLTQLR
jgi:hypothetical protein